MKRNHYTFTYFYKVLSFVVGLQSLLYSHAQTISPEIVLATIFAKQIDPNRFAFLTPIKYRDLNKNFIPNPDLIITIDPIETIPFQDPNVTNITNPIEKPTTQNMTISEPTIAQPTIPKITIPVQIFNPTIPASQLMLDHHVLIESCKILQIDPQDLISLSSSMLDDLYHERLNSVARFRMRSTLEKEINQAYQTLRSVLEYDPDTLVKLIKNDPPNDLTDQTISTHDPTTNASISVPIQPPFEWLDPLSMQNVDDLQNIKEKLTNIVDAPTVQELSPTLRHLQTEINDIQTQLNQKMSSYLQDAQNLIDPYIHAITAKLNNTTLSQTDNQTIQDSITLLKNNQWSWISWNTQIENIWNTLINNYEKNQEMIQDLTLALKYWAIKKYLSDEHIKIYFEELLKTYDPNTQNLLIEQAFKDWHNLLHSWAPESISAQIFELACTPLFEFINSYAFIPQTLALATGTQTIFQDLDNVKLRIAILEKLITDTQIITMFKQHMMLYKPRQTVLHRHKNILKNIKKE